MKGDCIIHTNRSLHTRAEAGHLNKPKDELQLFMPVYFTDTDYYATILILSLYK